MGTARPSVEDRLAVDRLHGLPSRRLHRPGKDALRRAPPDAHPRPATSWPGLRLTRAGPGCSERRLMSYHLSLFSRKPKSPPGDGRSPARRGAIVALVAALAVPVAVLVAPSAFAADGPYNIDGDIPDAGTTELPDLFGSVKELGPLNSNTTKIGVIHNDALPTLGLTNPNGQVDLRRAWLDTERDTDHEPRLALLRVGARQQQRQRLHRLRVHAEPGPGRLCLRHGHRRPADRQLQPVGEPHGRRLHDPVGPAGRQQGPVPADLVRHRAEPDPRRPDAARTPPCPRRRTAPTGSGARPRST